MSEAPPPVIRARVNTTPRPLILTDNLRVDLRSALDALERRNAAKFEQSTPESKDSAQYQRANALFTRNNFDPTCNPFQLVNAFFDVAVVSGRHLDKKLLERVYQGTRSKERLSLVAVARLRQNVRYVLYLLWSRGKLLLPITFSLRNSVPHREQIDISPELARFCLSYPTQGSDGSTAVRMIQHVPRWLICTKWYKPEDICMQEALTVNRFVLSCNYGTADFPAPRLPPSTRLFLAECLKQFPDRLEFDATDLQKFDLYFAKHLGPDVQFSNLGTAIAISSSPTEKAAQRAEAKKASYAASRAERLQSEAELADAEHLVYVIKYPRVGWFPDVSCLSFIGVAMDPDARLRWSKLFDQYQSYRIGAMGFESTGTVERALRVLADYMCICLPVFYHVTGMDGLIPSCPREFTRYPFVDNRDADENGAPTFLKYVGKRFGRDSSYAHLNHVRMFFEYIERSYGDSKSAAIAGPTFRNPVAQEFDLPRVKGAKARRTNKKPFAKFVVPHLLSWLYAVEAFGIYLQNTGHRIPGHGTKLQTEQFGFVPVYFHLGSSYPLTEIPTRLVRPQTNFNRPSLAILRMLITGLETGLRLQGVQWLCRRKFDCLNSGAGRRDYFLLTVNTDKTNDGFTVPILPRVRELLLREKADQEAYGVEDREIYYENRSHSRFDKLVPLFRHINEHQPFGDMAYSKSWTIILEAFHAFFAQIGDVEFVRLMRPKSSALEWTTEGHQFCPLKLQPLYTPHSCRSTFITRRSPFIELDDVARLVGHSGRVVTSHYDYPEYDALGMKLGFADSAVQGESDPGARVISGPAFIKAKEQNSSLVSSFRADRDGTIQAFRMIALRRGLETDDDDGSSALALLRASPLSQIVFRETHICPVGEHCPEEVVAETGGERRCGTCPLACKCVEHLPAIAAKQRQLLERIQGSREAYNGLLQRKTEASELGEIYDAIEADFQEYLGWRLSEEILADMRHHLGPESQHLHVAQPEIVRKHLTRVVKESSQQEFILRRIVEANEYPTLATDRLRLQALKLKRRLMAGQVNLELLDTEDDGGDEIAGFARLVSMVLRSRNMTLEQLADSINRPLPVGRERILLLAHEER